MRSRFWLTYLMSSLLSTANYPESMGKTSCISCTTPAHGELSIWLLSPIAEVHLWLLDSLIWGHFQRAKTLGPLFFRIFLVTLV